MPLACVPSSARTARRFFATLNEAPAFLQARAQIAHLGNRHAAIVGDNDSTGIGKEPVQALDRFCFLGSVHSHSFSMDSRGAFLAIPL